MYRRKLGCSPVHNINRFVSIKCSSTILTESILEFDACYLLEYNHKVIHFESQPLGFEYKSEGKTRRYTPDFLVKYSNSPPEFIEVKRQAVIDTDKFQTLFQQQRVASDILGKKLVLLADKNIREQPYLENLKILHRYHTSAAINTLQSSIIKNLKQRKTVTISEAVDIQCGDKNIVIAMIYDLIAKKILTTDLKSSRLGGKSLVEFNYDLIN